MNAEQLKNELDLGRSIQQNCFSLRKFSGVYYCNFICELKNRNIQYVNFDNFWNKINWIFEKPVIKIEPKATVFSRIFKLGLTEVN